MLAARDGHELSAGDVGQALCQLDESQAVMWLGDVGGKIGASTAAYLRTLSVPGRAEPLPIGYWAHLFVLPEHRKLMLYPQLVFTMRRAMADLGIEAIITAMRRPNVTEGHLKLGFKAVCAWPVLMKPLRPFALLSKHRSNRLAGTVSPVGDRVWRCGQSLRSGGSAGVVSMDAEDVRRDGSLLGEIAGLLERASAGRFSTRWTADLLASRLAGGVDGEPYTVMLLRRGEALEGVAVCRMAERGHGIRTGVLLELVARDGDAQGLRTLASACERQLVRRGAEVLLWLDGAGGQASGALRGMGYREAPDETYRLIAYTSDRGDELLDTSAEDWRFTFLDHDAF